MKPASPSAWLENRYCQAVASTLLARTEFFELLEDATISPARLSRARAAWRQHAQETRVLEGLFAAA
jgi:hypothetical protein